MTAPWPVTKDSYWVIIVDRSSGACRSLLCIGPNAADTAHALAQSKTNEAVFATVVGRR